MPKLREIEEKSAVGRERGMLPGYRKREIPKKCADCRNCEWAKSAGTVKDSGC